jgi:four helix bundle protein
MLAKSGKELRVYQNAYNLAMDIFLISKRWPKEEKYSLTDQIRRSSRSVCANIREAWAKRRYEAHFISKLTDADAENSETDTWLNFALDCKYISNHEHQDLAHQCTKTGAMIGRMLNTASSFIISDIN